VECTTWAGLRFVELTGVNRARRVHSQKSRRQRFGRLNVHDDVTKADELVQPRLGRFALLEGLASDPPDFAEAHNSLGVAYARMGRAEDAEREFARVLELDPDSASASNGLGVARARDGDLDGAIAAWRRAVELSPTQFDAMLNLARALSDRSRPEAISYLERFVREAPEGRYREDLQKARALLREWRATDPTN